MRLTVVVLLLALVSAPAQTPKPAKKAVLKNPAAETRVATAPPFACPDSEAAQACKSYAELVKAKEKDLRAANDERFVCFRKNTDEFFVIAFDLPQFPLTWNERFKKMMVDRSATSAGGGYLETYKDGIENDHVMPSLFFNGKWGLTLGTPAFAANSFFPEQPDTKDNPSTVDINESQFSATYKYKSVKDEDVIYSLTIQRSTGRFAESYQKVSEQVPSATGTGRCIYQKAQ